ncbi:ABC transporter ATP-binding protein [[Mycoplasma] anseris]|uniref:ABC transporter ATP-binding protein n=1 Tax=[Mycoplasma] anseris TaxID=92400 RepID=A0A2Z4NDK0_9BACT|nr:ABC transporter ATP-binding protein [[Mycoplasma] anseris]AWX69586.1 ABC transporter ATP-binding protein [[Mycoplasma] anseris]
MLRIFRFMSFKYKILAFFSILLTIFQALAFLVVPMFISQLITFMSLDQVTQFKILIWTFSVASTNAGVQTLGACLAIAILIGTLSGLTSSYFAAHVSTGGARDIRDYLWRHLSTLSQKDIETLSHAKIMTRFTIDINRIQMGIISFLRTMIIGPANLILGLTFALLTDLKLSISFAVLIPLLSLTMIISAAIIGPTFKKEQKAHDQINNESQENILGAKVIKSYNLEANQAIKFEDANKKLGSISKRAWLSFNSTFNIVALIANLVVVIIFGVGGSTWINGAKNPFEYASFIGNINSFVQYTMIVVNGVVLTTFVLFNTYRANISVKRILEITNIKPDIPFVNSDKQVSNGHIIFKDVSFSYYDQADKNIIENINFEIKPGETLGIIGPTGSGKSTIVKLLSLDYKIKHGEILIDNHNIQEIDTNSLRNNISHVYQNPTILSGTIKSNLLFANPKATDEDVINATKISCAYEYINRFGKKYEHQLEQKGANLSGGQKQRLSIAQGVIRKPKILILDDSTSALDAKTEAVVRNNIKEAFKENQITTIIVAQKISSIMDADKIIVLNHGKIADMGKHDELLQRNELYREIALTQMGGGNE